MHTHKENILKYKYEKAMNLSAKTACVCER